MLDYTNSNIEKVAVHFVGNPVNEEELRLSKTLLDISDPKVRELLFKFFLTPFANPEFYSFTSANDDCLLNPVYNFVAQIFEDKKTFLKNAINIAKQLYDASAHPQIKSGDLFIVHFADVSFEDKLIEAIGIFKSENKQSFLKLNNISQEYSIMHEEGINIEVLDKGCLILNCEKEFGFRVSIVDKTNKSADALYWKDNFLKLKSISDDFHQTKEFLSIAKNFVTKQLSKDFEVDKTEQIKILNRSVEYFKVNDSFDRVDFEKKVFNDRGIIDAFRNFDDFEREKGGIEINDSFDISRDAVKKQTKIFKNLLRLDSNFDIYIHGDNDLIQKGVEKDGRKFYKIYYEKEQ